MLKTRLTYQDTPNLPVSLELAKSYLTIVHDELDAILQMQIEAGVEWASRLTNKSLASFSVVYSQDTPALQHELLLDSIDSIVSVKDFTTGEDVTYTLSSDNRIIYLEYEAAVIVNYTTIGESQSGINSAILDYILFRFNGQTDSEAKEQVYENLFPYIANPI